MNPATTPGDAALAYVTGPGDRRAITDACRELGLEVAAVISERDGDDSGDALQDALDDVAAGVAQCLVVRRLGDLRRGAGGVAAVLERVEAQGIRLVSVDVGLDTDRPLGRLALSRRARAASPTPAAFEVRLEQEPDAGPPPTATASPIGVPTIGYTSATGLSRGDADEALAKQRRAIESRCAGGEFAVVEIVGDREPEDGKGLERHGLAHVLQRIAAGDASCLLVCDLARLSRSVAELGRLVRWLEHNDVRLVALDVDLDTATEAGRTTARALASVGEWDRAHGAEAAPAAVTAARAAHPADIPTLRKRIAAMRAGGMTLQAIADVLNDEGVPTQRGGAKWRPSSVQSAAGYRRPKRGRNAGGGRQAGPAGGDERS